MSPSTNSGTPKTEYYSSKYGRIAIMNGFNYTEFKHSCQLALVAANAWNIVNGTEAPPERSPAGWEDRRRKAIMLIGSSLEETIQGKVLPYSLEENVVGMWREIAKS